MYTRLWGESRKKKGIDIIIIDNNDDCFKTDVIKLFQMSKHLVETCKLKEHTCNFRKYGCSYEVSTFSFINHNCIANFIVACLLGVDCIYFIVLACSSNIGYS